MIGALIGAVIGRTSLVPALFAVLVACGPDKGTPTQPPVEPPADDIVGPVDEPTADAPTEPETPPRPHTCGTAGLTLEGYDWVPPDARAAIAIALDDRHSAEALARLAELGQSDEHGLPITFAFAVTQWPIVVPVLGTLLDGIGLQPGELVYVAPAKGPAFAWVVRSDCDLEESLERVEEAWGLVARRRVEGVVATTPPDPNAGDGTLQDPPKPDADGTTPPRPREDPGAFPYDVVFARGGRVALVPRGHGDAFLEGLAAGQGTPTTWTEKIEGLAEAPVRGILTGHALLGSKAKRIAGVLGLRAEPEAVVVEPLEPPPEPKSKSKKKSKRRRKPRAKPKS